MLQHSVAKAQRLLPEIADFAHHNVPVFLFPRSLIKRQQTMPHGAGVHRPHWRKPQIDQLVHPVLKKRQILFIPCLLIGVGNPIISHSAGPFPCEIHLHGPSDDPVYHIQNLLPVIFQLHPVTLLVNILYPPSVRRADTPRSPGRSRLLHPIDYITF